MKLEKERKKKNVLYDYFNLVLFSLRFFLTL